LLVLNTYISVIQKSHGLDSDDRVCKQGQVVTGSVMLDSYFDLQRISLFIDQFKWDLIGSLLLKSGFSRIWQV
jgi:hypothetical protein